MAVVEIVTPGNKRSNVEFRAFVEKSAERLRQGIHLLVLDLFSAWDAFPTVLKRPARDNLPASVEA